jgi:RsiW-degrading membrane proteinase PrsW (M82 family)
VIISVENIALYFHIRKVDNNPESLNSHVVSTLFLGTILGLGCTTLVFLIVLRAVS